MKNPNAILVIDDNPDDLLLAKRAITKSRPNCSVFTAYNSMQAVEFLDQANPISLILLDLKMPENGGIEILTIIKNRKDSLYIPVVMLTSSTLENDILSSYQAGASGFIHKSHDFSEFSENLKTTLHYWIDVNLLFMYHH